MTAAEPIPATTHLDDVRFESTITTERSVLGALMIGPLEQIAAVRALLPPEAFHRVAHRKIYEAILSLAERSEPPDMVLICAELERRGDMKLAEGPGTVALMYESYGGASNALARARIVLQHWGRRRARRAANRILEASEEASFDLAFEVSAARAELAASSECGAPSANGAASVHYMDLAQIVRDGLPAVPWLIPGWLAEGDVALLAGDGGIGKSTTAAALALSLASGSAWCGLKPSRAVSVLYFDEEQSEDELARIFIRLLPASATLPPTLRVAAGQDINLARGLGKLEGEIALHRPAMVFLDSVQQILGGANENDATAVGALYAELFRLRRAYACGFVLLHHLRKPPGEGHLSPYHLIRGTGAFFTQSSTSWVATQPARGLLDLQQYKRRRGERLSLRIRYSAPEGPEGPAILTGEGPVEDQETQGERAQEFVVEYLADHGASKASVLILAGEAEKIPERAIQRALKQLAGPLKAIEKPSRGIYRLPVKSDLEGRLNETW